MRPALATAGSRPRGSRGALVRAARTGWPAISRASLAGWLVSYGLFLVHAITNKDGFLVLDHVNLVIHEAAHFFLRLVWLHRGHSGRTLGELLVPLFIAVYFCWRRETAGTAFAAFWFFENFLYIGTYMADARTLALPLVGSGEHDWEVLFGQWGLLVHDRAIGSATRQLGWAGMFATVAWLVWMARRSMASNGRVVHSR